MKSVLIKSGREKSILKRHPWIFSGAIAAVHGDPENGDTVQILSEQGEFLAWGAYSSTSQIRIRIWSWDPGDEISPDFFQERITQSIKLRDTSVGLIDTDAVRLIHAESDGLPGLIVDRYQDTLVIQCLSWGIEKWREVLVDILVNLTRLQCVYERSDAEVRRLEGLEIRSGSMSGSIPPERILIYENEIKYLVDVKQGHKTGFYLDQRANRKIVGQFAKDREVLDCFSYTGGFALAALQGGASTCLAIESSGEAIELAGENVSINEMDSDRVEWMQGNAFQMLRKLRDQGRSFDMVILDPPKFAATAAHVERAARGYKDINLLGFKLLRPGGILVSFSCSGGVGTDLFQKIVAGAALDAGVEARIIQRLSQDWDHPVALNFPEGAYLKGLVLYVDR